MNILKGRKPYKSGFWWFINVDGAEEIVDVNSDMEIISKDWINGALDECFTIDEFEKQHVKKWLGEALSPSMLSIYKSIEKFMDDKGISINEIRAFIEYFDINDDGL